MTFELYFYPGTSLNLRWPWRVKLSTTYIYNVHLQHTSTCIQRTSTTHKVHLQHTSTCIQRTSTTHKVHLQCTKYNPRSTIHNPQSAKVHLLSTIHNPQSAKVHLLSTIHNPQSAKVHLLSTINNPQSAKVHLLSTINNPQSAKVHLLSTINNPQSAKVHLLSTINDPLTELHCIALKTPVQEPSACMYDVIARPCDLADLCRGITEIMLWHLRIHLIPFAYSSYTECINFSERHTYVPV